MNIWIVCYPTFWWSGIVATELGKALAKKWNKVHFISSSEPVRLDAFMPNVFFHEVNAADYPLFEYVPYESALTSKLVDIVKHEKLDILHVHYALPHASAAYMAQQILKKDWIHIPFVTTLHGTDITVVGKDASYEPVISFAIEHSDAVTSVSESLKQETYAHFNVQKDISVIPNFINFEHCVEVRHDNELRKTFAPDGEKILVHVSNLRKVKRVEDVIKVFHHVLKNLPAKLLIVGDGPERSDLEQLCRELWIDKYVEFLGKVRHIEKILSACDLFLITSSKESFGLSALEAMASGVPVVSSNAWGIPEVNIHGVTWYLADVWDIETMWWYAVDILSDEVLLEKLSKQAHAQAKNFCINKILPMYEEVYEGLLS